MSRAENRVLEAQALYFAATGIWPLLHMRSFEAVTGPKVDRWLVKTVGLCVACIGGALWAAARNDRVTPEIRGLAVSSSLALTGIDVYYSAKGRISPVYLLDAVAELGIVAALTTAAREAEQAPV